MDHKIKITIGKDDSLEGKYGAWVADWEEENLILLNVEAHFSDMVYQDGTPYEISDEERIRLLIESAMHEFGHCLEEYFKLNFDEDFVENVCKSYKALELK